MNKLILSSFLLGGIYYGATASITVKGTVIDTQGNVIPHVPVSDGHVFVYTDDNGNYNFNSDFDLGLLFISTPNGYQPSEMLEHKRPKFWSHVGSNDTTINFTLTSIPSGIPTAVISIADMQISDRAGDRQRLASLYVPDLNRSIDSLRRNGLDPIILTLGDQTCDYYWLENDYQLDDFNRDFTVNCPVYHTMGNHDNDPCKPGDMYATSTWRELNGPAYYSFNRGGAHFIVLDNMIYKNVDAKPGKPGKRDYSTGLTKDQLEWLANDLNNIQDKDAPLFISMHGILFNYPVGEDEKPTELLRMTDGGEEFMTLLKPFSKVKVLTGHAHDMHFRHSPDKRIKEYNMAGANGTWWSAKLKPVRPNFELCRDGSPWGYAIWDLSASDPTPVYKGFGLPTSHQMRVYDLNKLVVDDKELTDKYLPGDPNNRNKIMANIWAYEDGCKVRFIENGKDLKVKRVRAQDPLFFNIRAIPLKKDGVELITVQLPEATAHMFEAVSENSDTPITVEFTDLAGNTYTETISRK